ncbi:MAG TPA: hypothetical protein VEU47_10980 [Candidatus Cybelea sp.]|nr:hypothetical protein [Candidatus Cybelea sp.]
MMKGIDPKYIMYLGLLVTIEQAVGHGTISLTNIVPADIAPYVTSWCNLLAFIGTTIMTGQAAVSSSATGPLISAPPPSVTPTVVKILIAAFLLSALVFPGSAMAQSRPHLTGDIGKDLKSAIDQQNAKAQAIAQGSSTDPEVSCDFKIFLGLTPKNLEAAIKKCLSDANSTLVDDTQRALDSAKAYTQTGASSPTPDNDAINCLTPGLAILKAGVIVPAVPEVKDASGNITMQAQPAKSPGLILLFQKYREFVLSGGLTSCKTWVDTAVNATATQAINNVAGIATLGAGAALLVPK